MAEVLEGCWTTGTWTVYQGPQEAWAEPPSPLISREPQSAGEQRTCERCVMAVSLSSSNLLLLLVSSLDWLSAPGSAFLMDHASAPAPLEPHFTECTSRNRETFRCRWSPGRFHNLSAPGALRVFYMRKQLPFISPTSEWKECPQYIYENKECFFGVNHTTSWLTYCVQLRGQNNVTYYNEDDCFTVEGIVRPDPPVSLNWTLLKMSPSGLSYDVKVTWNHPPSADVKVGWMHLEYELQYQERNATSWEALDIQTDTQQTIYGLQAGTEYEVHIRCRMFAYTKFGEFSDSIFIQMPGGAVLPITLIVVFGIVGILILILLIVVSQQHRVMMILLPPIPAPKIKGIDSELLKKGKLDELNFIMSGEGMGGLPTYAPDFYRDEPWVEFIEVDAEYPEGGEKEEGQSSDTQRLLGLPQPSVHMNRTCSSPAGFADGDSGPASSYDPDVPNQDTLMLVAALLPGQPEDGEAPAGAAERSPPPERGEAPAVHVQATGPQTWVNTDFYAQVSNVMPSGGVVLSPGQQLRIQEASSATQREAQKKGAEREDAEEAEGKEHQELQFQLLVVDAEGGGYTSESSARQMGAPPGAHAAGEGPGAARPHPHGGPAATAGEHPSPYILPDSPPPPAFAPVADYTVIQEVDSKHSVLVDPPPHQPPPCLPQHPAKTLPALPVGYVTPDLLGNLAP
ncbi:growth hormone receptor a isoform X2 [Betta splendens]|uniref:Growth hormone receptor a isoform X2 n=1 Tax=Betta splendens TaxID=158456 RepID=A0A9W2Y0T4_BETSP|nr:growth hormone receptor a isoform X2 [Betta splendens]